MNGYYTESKLNISTPSSIPTRKHDWDIAVILWLAFGVIGLVLNIFEFIFIICKKKHATQFGLNLLSLSVADTIACLSYCFYASVMISIYAGFSTANSSTYRARAIAQLLIFSSITTSFTHIVLIALQRLWAVLFPYTFSHVFTVKNNIRLLTLAWIIASMYSVGYIFSNMFAEIACYQIFIVGTALIIIYCVITYKARRKLGRRRSHVQSNHNRKILLHSIGVTLIYTVCNFPYAINFLFFSNHRAVRKYFYALLMIRPLVDPLIYLSLYRGWNRSRVGRGASSHVVHLRTQGRQTDD